LEICNDQSADELERRYERDPTAFLLGDTEEDGGIIDYLALDHYYELAERND
jgi:hypothetical protein